MVSVSGEIFRKKISKDVSLVLSYDWESYEYGRHGNKKAKYSGTLPGSGETAFMIEKEKSSTGNSVVENLWVYRGGGDLDLSLKKNIPKEVLDAWNEEINKLNE